MNGPHILLKRGFRMSSGISAFWLSPDGKILPVMATHIHYVIDEPAGFGFSRAEIKKIYTRYGEALGAEACAREEIICQLVKRGWIRIRKYHRPDRWSVNVASLSAGSAGALRKWARTMIDRGESGIEEAWLDLQTERRKVLLQDLAYELLLFPR